MSYVLRDRSDGWVEIVFLRPDVIGAFPERDMAEKFRAFLKDEQPELPELPDDRPVNFREAKADAEEAASIDLSEILPDEPKPVRKAALRTGANLPAVLPAIPHAPVPQKIAPHGLSDEQVQTAFTRLQSGEKLQAVATDFGVPMFQLRGMWANHKRQMQRFMAEDGQQPCRHCKRPFTPSISNPDICARCSQ